MGIQINGATDTISASDGSLSVTSSESTFSGIATFTDGINLTGPSLISVNSSSNALRITQTGSGNVFLAEDQTNPDGSPFVITGSGNVGIGLTNPGRLMSIMNSSGPILELGTFNTAANPSIFLHEGATGSTTNGGGLVYDATNNRLNIVCGATIETTRMTINRSNGHTGIGTDNPGRLLQVYNASSNPQVNIKAATGGICELQFGDNADEVRGNIVYNCASDYLSLHGYNNDERLRITSGGDVQISTGNLVLASGKGIDFSATGNGSGTTTSELFEDYEEGTWTPTASNYGGTMQVNSASYVKVGNLCYIHAYVGFDGTTDGDDIRIDGLPFTPNGINNNYYLISAHTNGGLEELHLRAQGTTTQMAAVHLSSGNGDAKPSYTALASKFIIFGGCYRTT